MASMLPKTCDPFRAAGAPDEDTREAAEEIADLGDRLIRIASDVKLLKRMLGFNLALSMAAVALSLRVLAMRRAGPARVGPGPPAWCGPFTTHPPEGGNS